MEKEDTERGGKHWYREQRNIDVAVAVEESVESVVARLGLVSSVQSVCWE